jgi:hypothetical protein
VVGVLAESPHLTPEEKELLVGSFLPENLHWVSSSGRCHPIRRGSMMGNLMSFNVLCLINRACWGIVDSLRRKRGCEGRRRVLINGDDIAFAGCAQTYADWESVTSHFGLVVNRLKTGRSRRWLELNSRSFEISFSKTSCSIRPLRKPVLSCLLPGLDPSCLLTRLWDGLRTLSPGSLRMMIVELRYDIIARGVSLSNIPGRLRRVLLKQAWFRQALLSDPVVVEEGLERAWPVVTCDFGPCPSLLPKYNMACRRLLALGVRLARGIKAKPFRRSIRKVPVTCPVSKLRLSLRSRWAWRWPEPLRDFWVSRGLPVRWLGSATWLDDSDHCDLTVAWSVHTAARIPPPPSLLAGTNVSGFVSWPNGLV